MRELAVQASSDTNTADDRAEIQKEIDQLTQEVDRIGNTTEFNTKKLLNGGAGITTNFDSKQVNGVDQDWISVVGGTADTQLGTDLNITAATKATSATSGSITLDDGNTAVTTAGTLKINGYSINVAAGLNENQLADLVNQYSDYTGVTATAGTSTITFNTKDVGSSAKLDIEGIIDVINTSAGSNTSTTFGSDATITSSDLLTGGSYVAHGNYITITSGNYKGLELKINANVASDNGTQNTAQFDITQNGSLQLQIGANEGQNMSISIGDMRAAALGVDNIDVTTQTGASDAISTIDDAIKTVSAERAKLGAYQNRLEHTINNLGASSQNLTAAESRIRDVDYALAA
jgi:flagellin